MADYRLLKKQKQDVFDAIRAQNFDPYALKWKDENSRQLVARTPVSLLYLPNERFSFLFDVSRVQCSPWENRRQGVLKYANWNDVINFVGRWTVALKLELETPDPWERLPEVADAAALRFSAASQNSRFTAAELRQVAKALEAVRGLLLNYIGESREQALIVEAQLSSLVDASSTMGRKDWFNIAVGALITLAVEIALPPSVVRQAFDILKTTLGGIIQFVPQVLAGGPPLLG